MGKYIEVAMISCPRIIKIYIKRAVTARTEILSYFQWFYVLLSRSILPSTKSVVSVYTIAKEREACTIYKRLLPHYFQEDGNLKSIIFRDMTPCRPLSVNRRFGGTYRLHLQGRWNTFSKKTCLTPACLMVSCWTYFFDPEDGGYMFLRNVGWHSTDYTASYPIRWYSS
jgi:hypothetical protein